jgi:hypothetical protein
MVINCMAIAKVQMKGQSVLKLARIAIPDIGQESAYTCKLSELPTGTPKGFLHFAQAKEVSKSHQT